VDEKQNYAEMQIGVKKRLSGYMEAMMTLPASLDSPDML
jgi:hypothetical protein